MKRLPYLLILLLISAGVDDAWAAAPGSPSAQLADDNDEYTPAYRRPRGDQPSSRQEPVCDRQKPQTVDFSVARRRVPSGRDLTTPFAPPPLYVFKSLQI
jgi:hypothetical protein